MQQKREGGGLTGLTPSFVCVAARGEGKMSRNCLIIICTYTHT